MQRYFSSIKNDDYFTLSNNDIYHIKTVMRFKDDDKIEVVYKKNVYLCCIENVKENVKFRAIKMIPTSENNNPFITLIIPLLREQKLDLILQKSTELGVDKIIMMPMERSVIRVNEGKLDSKMVRWSKILKEASEQSLRTSIPVLEYLESIKSLDNLDGLSIICSTTEKVNNIKKVLKNVNNYDKINLVIGPEGGFSKYEEEYLESIKFIKTSLGNQIMRVETVPMFLLSVINYEYLE